VDVNILKLLAGYKLYDNESGKEVGEELDTYDLNKIILDYKCKWTQHFFTIKYKDFNHLVYEYFPTGSKAYDHGGKVDRINMHEDGTCLKLINTLLLLLLMIF